MTYRLLTRTPVAVSRFCLSALLTIGLCSTASAREKYSPVPQAFFQAYFPTHSLLIEPGDVLSIRFFLNPELDKKVTVRPDGKISLDFFQGLFVNGLSPEQLQQKLVRLYSEEFRDPVITVNVDERSGDEIYVTGEVASPGAKPLRKNMTVAMALAASEANQKTAGLKSVFLIRSSSGTTYQVYRLDANFPSGPSRDVYLAPGDILFVPRKLVVKAGDFVEQYVKNLLPGTPNVGASILYTAGNPTFATAAAATH